MIAFHDGPANIFQWEVGAGARPGPSLRASRGDPARWLTSWALRVHDPCKRKTGTDRASVSKAAARRGAPPLPACRSGPPRAAWGGGNAGIVVGCRHPRGEANGWRRTGRPTARSGRAPPGDGWSEDGGAGRRHDPLATRSERDAGGFRALAERRGARDLGVPPPRALFRRGSGGRVSH